MAIELVKTERARSRITRSGFALLLVAGLAVGMNVSAPQTSHAQEISQEHLEAAKAALASGGSTVTLDNILPNLAERMKGQLILSQPNLESEIAAIVDESAIEIAPRRGDLEDEVARLYANVFTKEELEEIKAFYETEAGKKLLAESPVLIREIGKASRTWTAGVDRDLRALIAAKMQKLTESKQEEQPKEQSTGNN